MFNCFPDKPNYRFSERILFPTGDINGSRVELLMEGRRKRFVSEIAAQSRRSSETEELVDVRNVDFVWAALIGGTTARISPRRLCG